jgi:predicted esterase
MSTSARADDGPDLGFHHVFEAGESDWTLLLLHSTGGNERELLKVGRRIDPRAALLSPRGKVLEGALPRFFRRHSPGELDIPDLLERTDEMVEFVLAAADAYGRDPRRIIAVGYSNGANLALSLVLRHPGLLRGAVLLRTMLAYEPQSGLELDGTPVLIAAGEGDPHVGEDEPARLAELLRECGAGVELNIEAGAGHELTPADYRLAARWAAGVTGGSVERA